MGRRSRDPEAVEIEEPENAGYEEKEDLHVVHDFDSGDADAEEVGVDVKTDFEQADDDAKQSGAGRRTVSVQAVVVAFGDENHRSD